MIGFPWWQPRTMPSRSDVEIRELALALLSGQLVTSDDVPSNLTHMVFFPLVFMTDELRSQLLEERPGLVYGHLGKHRTMGHRAINGWPMFAEMGMLSQADTKKLYSTARRLHAAAQEVPVG